jgi:hypothetical protein
MLRGGSLDEHDPETDMLAHDDSSISRHQRARSGVASQLLSMQSVHVPSMEGSGKPSAAKFTSAPSSTCVYPAVLTIVKTSSDAQLASESGTTEKLPMIEQPTVADFTSAAKPQGMLSAVLRGDSVPADSGQGDDVRHATPTVLKIDIDAATTAVAVGAAVLLLSVFMPGSKAPLKMRVPEAATVADVISELVRYGSRQKNVYLRDPLIADPSCYELRLHERNGEPDVDFPPLNPLRKIVNFGQGRRQTVYEYCLRGIPSVISKLNKSIAPPAEVATTTTTATMSAANLGQPMLTQEVDFVPDVLPPVIQPVRPADDEVTVNNQPVASNASLAIDTSKVLSIQDKAPGSGASRPVTIIVSGKRDVGALSTISSPVAVTPSRFAQSPTCTTGTLAGASGRTPRRSIHAVVSSPIPSFTGDQASSAKPQLTCSSLLTQPPSGFPPPALRVVIPGYPTPTVTMVPLSVGLRVQEALEFVARRHRLPVFHEHFVLRVVAADQVSAVRYVRKEGGMSASTVVGAVCFWSVAVQLSLKKGVHVNNKREAMFSTPHPVFPPSSLLFRLVSGCLPGNFQQRFS